MRRIIALIGVGILSFNISEAQILNIEKFRMDTDTFNVWAGNVGLGLSTKKQKTSFTTLNANSNVAYYSRLHSYMNISFIKFLRVEGSNLISEGYTHFRTVLYRQNFLSYEPFFQYQYDLGRGLERRELYGYTFRAKLFSSEKILVSVNTGAMYEHEIWEGEVLRYSLPEQPGRAETKFAKSTSNVYIRGDISPSTYLLLVTYYQARFEKFFAPRIVSEIQLNFTINKYFTFSNQFVSTYDDLPIISNSKFIYSYNSSILVKF